MNHFQLTEVIHTGLSDQFLFTLTDTSGNFYRFGKAEVARESFLIKISADDAAGKSSNYIQLYKGYNLKPVNQQAIPRKNVTPDWFFPLILIVLIIFTWIRIFYTKFFSQMIQALLNSNLANQIVRDENIFVQRASIYLSIVFNLIGALFLYLLSVQFDWRLAGIGFGFSRFLFFMILVSSAYAIKFLSLKICGWLFEQEKEIATYIFNIFLINNILGITLLPFIFLFAYNKTLAVDWILIIPLFLIGIAFCWRIFRGIQIGLSAPSFSPLYLFLYLCTLEIAPLLIIIKMVN